MPICSSYRECRGGCCEEQYISVIIHQGQAGAAECQAFIRGRAGAAECQSYIGRLVKSK